MEPTISKGSYIIGNRILGTLRRGDVVIFELDGHMVVKRIAGVPEDRIWIVGQGKKVFINADEVHTTGSDPKYFLTVPPDHYFMLGDNVNDSIDSRYWDNPFVHRDQIKAKWFG